MFRIALCDDDPGFREKVEKQLKHYAVQNDIERDFDFEFRYFKTADELINTTFDYQILFLDIVLEENRNGIEVGLELRQKGIDAVFILLTSMDYFQEGYRANVLRYLKKPIDPVDFFEAMNAAIQEYRLPRKRFVIKMKGENVYVSIGDIILAETYYRKRVLHVGEEAYQTTQTWPELCKRLPDDRFFSPQKSIRISFDHVVSASSTSIILSNARKINFSRGKGCTYADFNRKFQKYLGG